MEWFAECYSSSGRPTGVVTPWYTQDSIFIGCFTSMEEAMNQLSSMIFIDDRGFMQWK